MGPQIAATTAGNPAEQYLAHLAEGVWRALTDPDLVACWWAPGAVSPLVRHRFNMDIGAWGSSFARSRRRAPTCRPSTSPGYRHLLTATC